MADQTKARQDEDVNLGVAKKPEQVHIEHRVATTPWVESGGVSVAIGEEHRESTRKHGQGEQEQKVGDEHAPHKQGNSLHRQCRPAHEKDGGENVDRAGKAAEPRQMEAHDGYLERPTVPAWMRGSKPMSTPTGFLTPIRRVILMPSTPQTRLAQRGLRTPPKEQRVPWPPRGQSLRWRIQRVVSKAMGCETPSE